jgi:hypothetical protein
MLLIEFRSGSKAHQLVQGTVALFRRVRPSRLLFFQTAPFKLEPAAAWTGRISTDGTHDFVIRLSIVYLP